LNVRVIVCVESRELTLTQTGKVSAVYATKYGVMSAITYRIVALCSARSNPRRCAPTGGPKLARLRALTAPARSAGWLLRDGWGTADFDGWFRPGVDCEYLAGVRVTPPPHRPMRSAHGQRHITLIERIRHNSLWGTFDTSPTFSRSHRSDARRASH
jgi:hypothetical protein